MDRSSARHGGLDKVPLVPKMRDSGHAILQRSCIPTFEALAVGVYSRLPVRGGENLTDGTIYDALDLRGPMRPGGVPRRGTVSGTLEEFSISFGHVIHLSIAQGLESSPRANEMREFSTIST